MSETANAWIIRGGGLAAWAAAALLARNLPSGHSVRVEDATPPALGEEPEVAIADPDGVLVQLSDGADLLAQGHGGFFLGSLLRNWRAGQDIAVVEQEPLPGIDGVALADVVLRAARQSPVAPDYAALLAPLQFQARVMAAGRYAHPSPDRQSPRSLLRPRLMLDARVLTTRLREIALRAGVREGSGDAREAEPFMTVDTRATGVFSGDGDWTARLGYDRCLSVRYAGGDHAPRLDMTELKEGLATRSPLPGGGFASLAYAADRTTAEKAKEALTVWLGDVDIVAVSDIALAPGLDTHPWIGRRLAFGPAAVRFGDALGLDSDALERQLTQLIASLPDSPEQIPACAETYNQAVVRDVTHRADRLHLTLLYGPQGQRSAPAGENLARRIAQFTSRNGGVALDGDPYDAQHWTLLMAGLGLTPRRHDIQADRLDIKSATASLGRMVMAFDQTLAALPLHSQVVERLRAGG
ncbi:tryptophan 7-halogenase [Brevundimonas sp. SORGH_AS_0993]|uniref:tryptophan 7-halogenase n=1 Tax=Brevundimonas sp. SORGH_AS_0993 TaxID=3041794 RepID=UPI002785CBD4|nr:tryptophan 7-halogenase [Brevundimonas sp. SORGH_AS_0993]MDQ1153255.1 tryptophan halogenase [Brevundimonas sp. SORGH_AS_0993]